MSETMTVEELIAEARRHRDQLLALYNNETIETDLESMSRTLDRAADALEAGLRENVKLQAEVAAWRERFPVAGFNGRIIVLSG